MAYSLKHIPEWNALELKYNGKNTTQQNARFLNFMNNIPELYQPDDFTFLIPQKYFDSYYEQFSYSTTMTQTVSSIRGDEKVILPEIDYELKHMDTFKLKPFPFQRVGISFLVSVKAGILGDEMGESFAPSFGNDSR